MIEEGRRRTPAFFLFAVVCRVLFNEIGELRRNVLILKNGFRRAFIDTHIAVNASVGINVKHFGLGEGGFIFGGMNAIDGAHHNTRGVFYPDARFGDDVGHEDAPAMTIRVDSHPLLVG
jgi:hypothetical protein